MKADNHRKMKLLGRYPPCRQEGDVRLIPEEGPDLPPAAGLKADWHGHETISEHFKFTLAFSFYPKSPV